LQYVLFVAIQVRMAGILAEIAQLGFSTQEFMRRSGVSVPTLKRIDAGDPNVRPNTLAKAYRTLRALKAEVDAAPMKAARPR
jgi:predicted transcriptional regulator